MADSADRYPPVAKSNYALRVNRQPMLRLDFSQDMHTVPGCRWNVHAECAALTAPRPTVSALLATPTWTSAGGKGPRFATLDPTGTWLYCTNERSDTITRFRRDPATGDLGPADPPVATGSPVCLVFKSS